MNACKEYALYKGDEFIVIGTLEEIAEHTGKKLSFLKWLKSKVAYERAKKQEKGLILIELEGANE